MLAKPRADLKPNTAEYERQPLIKATGFREYDARWQFEKEINLYGIQALGMGLGTLLHQKGIEPKIVVGHDFRSYSASIKNTLISGLMAAGCTVHDIGLAVSPMAYFAQFELDIPAVAMVTASHNDNGWTGVKMGCDRPLTFGPDEMLALKEIVLNGKWEKRSGGGLVHVEDMAERYIANLTKDKKLERPLKVVCACGNGTAGAFSPQVLRAIGCEVVELDCELDHSFPNYNPNPEALKMLHAMADKVKEVGADVGLGFDGDGDRCGVVDNQGNEIFADKIGVMIARDISTALPGSTFVADVKSTSLFATDPVLLKNGAKADFYKTGHSYIKARTTELDAVAGFEKSGHFFFRAPYGLGYDDGLVSAIMVCEMLDHAPDKTMADLYGDLPKTWGSPTMSPHCADEEKYGVVDKVVAHFQKIADDGGQIAGQDISEVITVNGIRIVLQDGTWGLVRASSNTPNLVVVVESPTSKENMKAMFAAIDGHLKNYPEVGEYDQKI
ncbi:Phosphoglucosamine mutase / Phosphomannomutase [hydrothermal vent metagenome]|uniref:Phosphoglucosamine mutase / Phosphomannomutase n=1 Tax=hydrothermal vent metagenome TaxID=652676 RepID=A0A3B0RD21_9ZZZZ